MKKLSLAFCSLLLIFSFYNNASACACCSETGTYHLGTSKTEGYTLNILSELEFDEKAYLMINVEGFDGIKGVDLADKDFETGNEGDSFGGEFGFTPSYAAKTWTLNFKTKGGKTGSLTLPMPAEMVTYKVDIHDGRKSGGGGPLLYKEYRFKGDISSGKGFFQKGIVKPTSYFLVFKGRGNGCDNAEDFTHWYLEVRGKNARYELIGRFGSGETENNSDEDEPKNSESEN